MSTLRHWLHAIRPKTLGISVAPVIVACALAWSRQQTLAPILALAIALCALLIQVAANLYNDAADFERGADTPDRLGPPRATAEGWLGAQQVKAGAWLCFALAFAIGIYLASVGGWPIVVIGLLSLVAGYAYTGGPWPISYSPTGELFVFLFFGLVAVTGSDYLLTSSIHGNTLPVGAAIGLLASAVLLVNNYRDLDTDRKANKLTLVHYLGRTRSRWLYRTLLALPLLLPLVLGGSGSWLVWLLLPAVILLIRRFDTSRSGSDYNRVLAHTAQLLLAYSLLLSLGLLMGAV